MAYKKQGTAQTQNPEEINGYNGEIPEETARKND